MEGDAPLLFSEQDLYFVGEFKVVLQKKRFFSYS